MVDSDTHNSPIVLKMNSGTNTLDEKSSESNNLHKLSDNEIILHYNTSSTNFGNNLIMQNKTKCLGMRDFMIEHSLERFLVLP